MAGDIRIGISGWTYAPWRGVFYPAKLPHKQELAFAARQFGTIEINGTHYGLQRPDSFLRWRTETPDDFVFAVKGSRYITHMLKLRDVKTPIANFFASGLLALGPKLGPLLWQFPPRMRFHPDVFDKFLALLPHDLKSAQRLARKHDQRLKGRAWLKIERNLRVRHAVEIRHQSFLTEEFVTLLRRYGVGLVVADSVDWPRKMDLTADFVYCRLHGSEELYTSGYHGEAIDAWAKLVRAWAKGKDPKQADRISRPARMRNNGRDVFVYFDNDAKVRAPVDARKLMGRLRLKR